MRTPTAKALVFIGISIFSIWGILAVIETYIPFESLYIYSETHRVLGAVLLGVSMCAATVFAPLTVLPLVPLMAPVLGPFTTGLASYIGWTTGSIISFWLARKYGQPLVLKVISEKSLDTVHAYIKPDMSFMFVVALRLVIPADALSYALGLFTRISYTVYVPATMIGIAWFSFAFAYLGNSITSKNYVLFGGIGVASVILLYIVFRYIRSR